MVCLQAGRSKVKGLTARVALLLRLLLRQSQAIPIACQCRDLIAVAESVSQCIHCFNFSVQAVNQSVSHEDRQWQDGSLCSSDAVWAHMALVLKGPVQKHSATLTVTRSYVKKLPKLDDTSAQDRELSISSISMLPLPLCRKTPAGWALWHRAGA